MSTYSALNKDFIQAIQQDAIGNFIKQLNDTLAGDTRNFLAWLFLAKSYEVIGDINKASMAFKYILRATDPGASTKYLVAEIHHFTSRHHNPELMALTDERFGAAEASPIGGASVDVLTTARAAQVPTKDTPEKGRVRIVPLKKIDARSKPLTSVLSARAPAKAFKAIEDIHSAPRVINARSIPAKRTGVAAHISEGNRAFDRGDLEMALNELNKALKLDPKRPGLILKVAQTLQRLQRYDEALQQLEIGLTSATGSSRPSMMNCKAQIFQSLHRWDMAAAAYEELLRYTRQQGPKRFIQLQLVSLYRRLRKTSEARQMIEEVQKDSPDDPIVTRIQAQLEHDAANEEMVRELQVELPSDNIDLISPMLQRDLVTSEFRDELIISRGWVPAPSDGDRLLLVAEATQSTEFGDRYPRFLEAAKAYSELPASSYEQNSYYRALTSYAMLKGGALVSDIRRQLLSGKTDLQKIRRLRDSATSYFLESLVLQVQVDVAFALVSLASYLAAQVAYVMAMRGEPVTEQHFKRKFDYLFKYCLDHPDDDLARIAYDSVVAWGAADTRVWNRLGQEPGGAGAIGSSLQGLGRERAYRILSDLTCQNFNTSQKPKEVLSKCFLERRRQINAIIDFFGSLHQLPLSVANFRELDKRWVSFPKFQNVLLETDLEVCDKVGGLLAILSPYNDRSPEERTNILFTARISIESLFRFIQENPTYWGRSWFEPLLQKWQVAIRSIERRRLSEVQPKLVAQLEPPVFRPDNGYIEGGVLLRNEGRGTAEGVKISLEIIDDESNEAIYKVNEEVNEEIKARAGTVESTYHHRISVDKDILTRGIDAAYRLRVYITPILSRTELECTEQEFTLEVHSGNQISVEQIPWDEVNIPSEHMFKGREQFINHLLSHLLSPERNKSYILYGLSRTGKTSILSNLQGVIDLKQVNKSGESYRLISFMWDLGKAKGHTNASDMWGYLLEEGIVSRLQQLANAGELSRDDVPELHRAGSVRFKDWALILDHLQARHLYPVFLVDEFSFFKELVDSKRIDASFLAAVRTYAITGKASFIFAGTYDLRKLIADPDYGVRGRLVNTNEVRVSRIDASSATALIKVMEPQLKFTPDAVDHILWLSYQLPYFIQLICKHCAYFAAGTERSIIGFPEVETVIRVLTGESEGGRWMGAEQLPPGRFHSNMYMPTDPPTYSALLTTICHLTKGQTRPRLITYSEIQQVWHRHDLQNFQAKLADAVKELTEREVLVPGKDEEEFAWRISVDLFRRWWANEHKNLELELDALKEDTR